MRLCIAITAVFLFRIGTAQAAPGAVDALALQRGDRLTHLTIRTSGSTAHRSFALTDPARFVIDITGADFAADSGKIPGDGISVVSVRASQFKSEPPVTRVVIDLVEGAKATLEAEPGGLRVDIQAPLRQGKLDAATRSALEALEEVSDPAAARPAQQTLEATHLGVPADGHSAVATITYVTPSSVYIDAGTTDGLAVGETVEVVRAGKVVASLEVQHLSSRKASCVVRASGVELAVGDRVQFAPVSDELPNGSPVVSAASLTPASPVGRPPRSSRNVSWLRSKGIRGRVGARYLTVQDRGGSNGQDFSQPALDLRIEGTNIDDGSFDMSVDVRTRRTYRSSSDGSREEEGRSRVYRANAAWHPLDSALQLALGRQYSPDLPSLSVFDGAAASMRLSRFSLGVLTGTQPDAASYGYSTQIREHGAFLQLSSSKAPADRWYLTTGVIGSYDDGEINREFLYLQGSYSDPRFSLYVAQDLDLNRGWKKEAEGADTSWTNSYANARVSITPLLGIHGGFDNRRSIRLYRDHESPETEFDDAYRQGYWAGVSQRFGRILRAGADARRSTGGSSGDADSYTGTLSVQWRVHLYLRSTYFQNQLVSGWMRSGSIGTQLGSALHVEIGGGVRDESSEQELTQTDTLSWTNFALDYNIGRHMYMSLSAERSKEGIEANDQFYATTTYRF